MLAALDNTHPRGTPMKGYLFIPFALLLGLVVGGWGPRSELRTLKQELRKTRRLLKETRKGGAGANVERVTELLGIESRKGAAPTKAAGAAPKSRTKDPTTTDATTSGEPDKTHSEKQRGRKKGMEENIDEAIELFTLRSDIARSTFLANSGFSEEDAIQFDVLMRAMNIRMKHSIETWVDRIARKEDPGAEDGIRLLNEVTDALVITYNEMDRLLPETWRETGGKDMELFDFVDPAVAKPLIRVENKLDDIGRAME